MTETNEWKTANNLGNVLMRMSVIDRKQLEHIVETQKLRKSKAGDSGSIVLFGDIAVELKYATKEQIQSALEEQQKIMAPASNASEANAACDNLDAVVERARKTSTRFRAASFALTAAADKL